MGAKMFDVAPRQYHGMTGTKEHRAWLYMKKRCFSDHCVKGKYYKGRGIGMCEEWLLFMNFYNDMGPAPSPLHTLDRIDNNGDYCKKNCRWALNIVQQNNKSNNVFLTHKGKTQTASMWAREKEMSPDTVRRRLLRGWTVEETLETPVGNRRGDYGYKVENEPFINVNIFFIGNALLGVA